MTVHKMKVLSVVAAVACVLYLVIGASAQNRQYPNELDGYRFFGSGKLSGLKLLVSTKEDVKRLFGENCEKRFDYDSNWSVTFEYFEAIWISESSNNKGDKLRYTLDPQYLGKLRVVELRPKAAISFTKISFPNVFERVITTSTTDARGGKSRMIVNDSFRDTGGLTYEIYGQTKYDDLKAKDARSFEKGELVLIRYDIPKDREKSLFVLQN